MTNKHAWWCWMLKNSICIICWTVLAIGFNHWWIAFFSLLFMTNLETKSGKDGYYSVCDCCGRYSPTGETRDDAENKRMNEGWIRKKINNQWKDICPECRHEHRYELP